MKFCKTIRNWLYVLRSKHFGDENIGTKDSSVFTNATDEAQMKEIANVRFVLNTIMAVRDNCILRLIFAEE